MKRGLILIGRSSGEGLKIGVLSDLLYQPAGCRAGALFERSMRQRPSWRISPGAHILFRKMDDGFGFDFSPGDLFREDHPALVTPQFPAERQMKVLKRKLVRVIFRYIWAPGARFFGGEGVFLCTWSRILRPNLF